MTSPYVIAEVAQGFEGSEKLVTAFVKTAAAVGADAVKFQVFAADELALPDYRYYGLFRDLELSESVWVAAVAQAHDAGIAFFSDVFGFESLRMLERCGADGYKVHTTDIDNLPLLRALAATGKRVLLSTGGAEQCEIDEALDALAGSDITLLYGFQAEPTQPADLVIGKLGWLRRTYGLPVGFMDHTEGGNPLAYALPFVALGAGASVIEKHLTLSRVAELEDFVSAMTAEEFAPWCRDLRAAAEALGSEDWVVTPREHEYRTKVQRAVVSAREIAAGHAISAEDVTRKRTDVGATINDAADVIGRTASHGIADNTPIREEDLT